jgi:glycosyltransferase involved in cell wall biosynthesis
MDITDDNSFAVIRLEWGSGGAPRVTETIAEILDADLYYGYSVNGEKPSKELNATRLFKENRATKFPPYREIKSALNINKTDVLEDYDVIIESGNKCGWYIPPATQTVIRYVHSIPEIYDKTSKSDSTFSQIYSLAGRTAYYNTSNFVDRYICNSEFVEKQVQKYLNVSGDNTSVIYPPVREVDNVNKYSSDDDYYLFISRLDPDKRIVETIEAFTDLKDLKLIIAGKGSEDKKVKKYADKYKNIEYEGYVTEDRKNELYAGARALVFPTRNEPFGMVPIESMSFGTPVITVPEGFPQYMIKDSVNGVLANSIATDDIKNAIRRFDSTEMEWSKSQIRDYARKFNFERFNEEIIKEVEYTIEDTNIESKTDNFIKDIF